jgi:hypothetical protein
MRGSKWGLMAWGLVLAGAVTAYGQPFLFTVDFESPAPGDEVIFQEPQFSGSTDGILTGEDQGGIPISNSQVVDWFGLPSQAYEVSFPWGDPADTTTAGVRCTTTSVDSLPRPSIHLDGIIRFKLAVTAFDFGTPAFPIGPQITDGSASILMCLGISESGNDLPLGTPDSGGDFEYIYPAGAGVIPAADSNGLIDFPPGGTRYVATTSAWPPGPSDFVQVTIDLSTLPSSRIRGFANDLNGTDTAGDGVLDATINPTGNGVNRGYLESIIFTSDPADTTSEYFFIYIDDLEFEAPVEDPTPPPSVQSPIERNDTTVTVTNISTNATVIELKKNGVVDLTTNGGGFTSFVFTLPAPAVAGDVYTANQTVDGKQSVDSLPVTVSFPGPVIGLLPKDGDTTVRISNLNPQADEVELFVGGVSRGTTATTNGIFTIDVAAGAALVMGEEVTATQIISGAASDLSPIAVVTTNSITQVFCDDFEYADQAAFDAVWEAHTGATNDTQLVLSSFLNATVGGSKSAYSDTSGSGNAANQSQLRAGSQFGPVAGTDTHPLIFNVSYHDGLAQESLYRQQAEIRPAPDGSPIIAMGNTNEITGNFHQVRQVPGGPSADNFWFNLDGFGQPQRTNGWHVLTAVVKSNSVDYYVDGTLAALSVPITAGTDFTTAVIGSGLSSAGGDAYYDDLCIDKGALSFNTITVQPPPPPTVVAPIIPGANSVTVENIDTNATQVALYRDGIIFNAFDPAGADTFNFFLIPNAVSGEVFTATQTVGGLTSPQSAGVTVLLPGPTLYKAPAAGETSVRVLDINTNASLVEVKVDGIVRGSANPNGATDVDVALGAFVLSQGEEVTAKIVVNSIDSVDSAPETVTTNVTTDIVCDDFESYADQAAFQASAWTPTTGDVFQTLSTVENATPSGAQSLFAPVSANTRVEQTFANTIPTAESPVVLTAAIFDPAGGGSGNQWVDANGLVADSFLIEVGMASCCAPSTSFYNLRINGNGGPNWINLDEFDGPNRSVGWHQFTVVHKGDFIDAYVDGLLARKNVPLSAQTTFDVARIGSGLPAGNEAYYDDYCLTTGPARFEAIDVQPPLAPTVEAPVEAGDTTVTVSGVGPDATSVTVYANGSPIGTLNDAGTNGTVVVPVTALVHLDAITADQTNATGTSNQSAALEVGQGNGDVLVSIGIRETGDAGPLGSEGGTSGAIEWIGASSVTSGAPQGVSVTPSSSWQTLIFDPASDPITAFTGDGAITGTRGTLEHLAVAVNAGSGNRSTGAFTVFIDNVVNVGADTGGSDFVIADFEANAPGDEVLFQEPTNSGSTFPDDLTALPSASEVTGQVDNGGDQSAVLRWFWKDTTAQRWARITTSAASFTSRPVIDITKPIRLDILLAPACLTVAGDADGDGDVDLADVDEFVGCLDGPATGFGAGCECADVNGDAKVDLADYAVMQRLLGS